MCLSSPDVPCCVALGCYNYNSIIVMLLMIITIIMISIIITVDFRNFIVFVWAETLAH